MHLQRPQVSMLGAIMTTTVCAILAFAWRGMHIPSILAQGVAIAALIAVFVFTVRLSPTPSIALIIGPLLGLFMSAAMLALVSMSQGIARSQLLPMVFLFAAVGGAGGLVCGVAACSSLRRSMANVAESSRHTKEPRGV